MTPERLLNRNFVLLWQGQLVSQLGNQAFFLAMMYWTMETTGSASLMGMLMMLSLLPGVILGPLGGTLADRFPRLGIIIISDPLRGVAVLTLAGIMAWQADTQGVQIASLFAVALFSGIINATFQPAITASIPDLVPTAKVSAGNSLNQFSVQGSVFIGQAIGGLLYRSLGAPVLFLIDGVTYLLSAASESFIRMPPRPMPERVPFNKAFATYAEDTAEGMRYVWHRKGMRAFLLLTTGVNFLAMPVVVLLPFYVTEQLSRGSEWYGFLLAAVGAGSLFGYLAAGALPIGPRQRPTVVLAALVGVAVAFARLGVVHEPVLALLMLLPWEPSPE